MANVTYKAIGTAQTWDSNTSKSVPMPTHAADDLLMCFVNCTGSGAGTIGNPSASGWTLLGSAAMAGASFNITASVLYKVATSSSETCTLTTGSGTQGGQAVILSLSNVDTTSPIVSGEWGNSTTSATTATLSHPSVTPTVAGSGLVLFRGVLPPVSAPEVSFTSTVTSAGGVEVWDGTQYNTWVDMCIYTLDGGFSGTQSYSTTANKATDAAQATWSILVRPSGGGGGGGGHYEEGSLPTYVGAGTVGTAGTSGGASPGLPSGWQEGDILVLCTETLNGLAPAVPSGWTEVTGSPSYANTGSATTSTAANMCWKRAGASETDPLVLGDSGNHCVAVIHALRGCLASGDPVDASAGATETTSDTSGVAPAVTTTEVNRFVVILATHSLDVSTSNRFTAVSNANLGSLTERTDSSTTLGNGGGLGVFTGTKATAGSTGTTSITYAASSAKGLITAAFRPTQTWIPDTTVGDSVGVLMA